MKTMKCAQDPLISEIFSRAAWYGLHTVQDIADASGISYGVLRNRFKKPDTFTRGELATLHEKFKIDLGVITRK